jgi:hypothetical protein
MQRHPIPAPTPPTHDHGSRSFEDALRDQLRRAPWLLVSVAAHALLGLVMSQFMTGQMRPKATPPAFVATLQDESIDPFVEPEPPTPPDSPETPTIDEDVIVPDVSEQTTQETETVSDSDSDAPIDAPFEGTSKNDVLGVGGGAGGRGGNGLGSRRRIGRPSSSTSQRAVDAGLDWLKRHQDEKGYWSAADFGQCCATNRCDGEGDSMHDVGVTGLALLAFLGAGHSPNAGKYQAVVKKGLKYLVDHQDGETGCFGEANSHQTFLYDHAIASLAVTEGYGLSKWPILKEPAQKGVRFIQQARNPYKAWRYAYPPDGTNDVSVTGWMVMALKSAEDFGLMIDPSAIDGARAFLEEMTDPQSYRTGYLARGGYSAREGGLAERWPETETEAMTAVAMLCRVFTGEDTATSPALRGGADLLRKQLPTWDEKAGTIDYYYWYYGSYAMYQMAGRDWDTWQPRMLDAVVKTQRNDGCEKGSWDPQFDPWGHRGGRVYATAIMTLCLEVYYRYDRVIGSRDSADRIPR